MAAVDDATQDKTHERQTSLPRIQHERNANRKSYKYKRDRRYGNKLLWQHKPESSDFLKYDSGGNKVKPKYFFV